MDHHLGTPGPPSRSICAVRSRFVLGALSLVPVDLCHPRVVAPLLDEVAAESPDAVYRSGAEIFVAADIAPDLVDRAEAAGIAILGLEGFLIDESSGAVYPSLARIADFSRTVESDRGQFVSRTCSEARATLADWSDPPAADVGMNVGALTAEITKIKAQLDSFKEIRKANAERFATINEQMGEIRGQVMDVNRNMGVLEVKVSKAADLVESVHPDKLMIQVQRSDGKVEGLRGLIESKDAMVQNIMEQLKTMRNQMKVFKGIEEVLKMNEDVKTEVMNMKKLTAIVERHADRVENVFVESQ